MTAEEQIEESRTDKGDDEIKQPSVAMEKALAPHSSTLAWRIPGIAEPGGLPSMGRTQSDMTQVTQQQQQHPTKYLSDDIYKKIQFH